MDISTNQKNKEDGQEKGVLDETNHYQMHYSGSSRRIDDESVSDDELGSEFNYAWDEEFFKKFDWLKDKEAEKREKETKDFLSNDNLQLLHGTPHTKSQLRAELLKQLCKLLENELIDMEREPLVKPDVSENRLYLYFISLESNKMFIHADFKKDYDVVLRECAERFEFVRLHGARKVVYTMIVDDLYDIDKHVKMFMHMFGVDDTRGGSYTNVEIPEYLRQAIEHERPIASIDYYAL